MINLNYYQQDWADQQARCILELVKFKLYSEFWSDVKVWRWENCREQGYVLSIENKKWEQLNITFYEHRNVDWIVAFKWIQETCNTPNINTLPEWVFENKWDIDFSVDYWEFEKMSDWIIKRINNHLTKKIKKENE